MRRAGLTLMVCAVLVSVVSGCGGGSQQPSSPKSGAEIFSSTCASCHTLKAAGSHGTVGPDLDKLAPDVATVRRQVTDGGGGMPAFKGALSSRDIGAVARYVAGATR